MTGCCRCEGVERQFGEGTATRDLRRYRRRGPIPTTRRLIEALRAEGVAGATLLDVGGGVGAIQHELLEAGARRATHVDAATHYLDASREEAGRRGHADRVSYLHGDFVELADEVADADVVTLDRVLCCYPDMPRLVERSAARARRLYGVVFPRDRIGTRLGIPAANLFNRLRRVPFRVHLHPPEEIDAAIRRQGFGLRSHGRTFLWHVAVYARDGAGTPSATDQAPSR